MNYLFVLLVMLACPLAFAETPSAPASLGDLARRSVECVIPKTGAPVSFSWQGPYKNDAGVETYSLCSNHLYFQCVTLNQTTQRQFSATKAVFKNASGAMKDMIELNFATGTITVWQWGSFGGFPWEFGWPTFYNNRYDFSNCQYQL